MALFEYLSNKIASQIQIYQAEQYMIKGGIYATK